MSERLVFRLDQPHARLDQALAAMAPDLSRRRARVLIANGAVFVDGRRCKVASRRLDAGARIVVHLTEDDAGPSVPVIFRDEHLLVVDKPPGLHVNETETRSALPLVARFADARLVHRLDRDTSGVMVLALSEEAARALSEAFRDRAVDKSYWAITQGRPAAKRIETFIGPDPKRPQARRVAAEGKPACTELEVLAEREGLCAVVARPRTGRTHQIRVHLAHAGAPIFGDTMYGGSTAVLLEGRTWRAPRFMLHARRLAFELFGQSRVFEASPPDDIALLWRTLRATPTVVDSAS